MRVVLCTTPPAQAETVARAVVESRVAACASIIPAVRSVYRWRGKVEHETESLLVIKTTEERVEALIARIREVHPYEVPEIIALPIDQGLPAYLDWVREQTTDRGAEP